MVLTFFRMIPHVLGAITCHILGSLTSHVLGTLIYHIPGSMRDEVTEVMSITLFQGDRFRLQLVGWVIYKCEALLQVGNWNRLV